MTVPEEKQGVSTDKRDRVVKHTIKDSVFTNLFKEEVQAVMSLWMTSIMMWGSW